MSLGASIPTALALPQNWSGVRVPAPPASPCFNHPISYSPFSFGMSLLDSRKPMRYGAYALLVADFRLCVLKERVVIRAIHRGFDQRLE